MLVPALVICVGVVVLVPLSPLLIFGIGPFPALGIAGGCVALVLFYAAGTTVLSWYILSRRHIARLRPTRPPLPLLPRTLGAARSCVGSCPARSPPWARPRRSLGSARPCSAGGPGGGWPPPLAPARRPGMAPRRGWNICWFRWSSVSARRWWRWSAPMLAPA